MEQLPEHEKVMLQKKYASPRFKDLNDSAMLSICKALLIKIHVITGWSLPEVKDILVALTDQFKLILLEDYPEMNCDEVEYAFRHYGATGEIKDWGKSMNLTLIQQVLIPYLNRRYNLGQMERRAKEGPEQLQKWECELNWAHALLEVIDKPPATIMRLRRYKANKV